jgi:hypothetical protein
MIVGALWSSLRQVRRLCDRSSRAEGEYRAAAGKRHRIATRSTGNVPDTVPTAGE